MTALGCQEMLHLWEEGVGTGEAALPRDPRGNLEAHSSERTQPLPSPAPKDEAACDLTFISIKTDEIKIVC